MISLLASFANVMRSGKTLQDLGVICVNICVAHITHSSWLVFIRCGPSNKHTKEYFDAPQLNGQIYLMTKRETKAVISYVK